MDNPIQNLSIVQKIHRFPKVWLVATIIIVVASLTATGFYLTKAYNVKNEPVATSNSINENTTASTIAPQAPAITAQQQTAKVSEELKAIDLAGLKTSISELKAVLGSFSSK